mgnify:FL=1
MKLADSASKLEGVPMFKLLARAKELEAKGKRIFHFEMGEPDFPSPDHIINAAISALKSGDTHYTLSMGLPELREEICRATNKDLGFRPNIDQVLVTPGGHSVIYLALRCLVNPGEEVIVSDPGFPAYYSAVKYIGAKIITVPIKEENNFRMNPADIRKKISKNTKLIIINSPHNPTGAVLAKEEIEEIALIAQDNSVFLLTDEIYSRMIYSLHHYSPAIKDGCQQRTIIINGFSKSHAMTGWRLGYAIGPKEVIEKMNLLLQTIIACHSPFIQRGGISALTGSQRAVSLMMEKYKKRRDVIVKGLNSLPGVSCLTPDGAIYAFPNISGTGLTSQEFSDLMLEEAGVALLPGTNFGECGKGYARLCFATSVDIIKEGIEKMRTALAQRI